MSYASLRGFERLGGGRYGIGGGTGRCCGLLRRRFIDCCWVNDMRLLPPCCDCCGQVSDNTQLYTK